jgi:hypothetical protein
MASEIVVGDAAVSAKLGVNWEEGADSPRTRYSVFMSAL